MTEQQASYENPSGMTPVGEPPSAHAITKQQYRTDIPIHSFQGQGVPQQNNVMGQIPITSFSTQQHNVGTVQGPGIQPVQTPPPQYYAQHPPTSNPYGVPIQYNHQQIAEFTVPADSNRMPSNQVVVVQPQMVQSPPVHVPDEMPLSVVTTLFCCLYLGIPAMIFASQANSLRTIDPYRALSKARTARVLNITAIVIGVIAIVVVLILRFTMQASSPDSGYY